MNHSSNQSHEHDTATSTSQRVQMKLFVGLLLNSEVRMHLNQSDLWNQDQIIRRKTGEAMQALRYQEKEYIGMILPQHTLNLEQLRSLENQVRSELERYCPELTTESMKVYVFPQVFLS